MKVRMINNEMKTNDANKDPDAVIQSTITIKVKTETDEDVPRYHDLIVAIEEAIDKVTTTPEILPEANWETL